MRVLIVDDHAVLRDSVADDNGGVISLPDAPATRNGAPVRGSTSSTRTLPAPASGPDDA